MSLAQAEADTPLPVTQQYPLPSASVPGALQVSTDVLSVDGMAWSPYHEAFYAEIWGLAVGEDA